MVQEYLLLMGIIAIVLVTMTPFLKRSAQAIIKVMSDQIAAQNEAEHIPDRKKPHLQESFSVTRVRAGKEVTESVGVITYYRHDDEARTDSEVFTNLGFTGWMSRQPGSGSDDDE